MDRVKSNKRLVIPLAAIEGIFSGSGFVRWNTFKVAPGALESIVLNPPGDEGHASPERAVDPMASQETGKPLPAR